MFSFRNLNVWQKSRQLTLKVYKLTKEFPKSEEFGLISQLRRATVSVASNLAEGSGRITAKDKAHFTSISYGSLMEVACQLQLAYDLKFIDNEQFNNIIYLVEEIARMLNALRQAQLNSQTQ